MAQTSEPIACEAIRIV